MLKTIIEILGWALRPLAFDKGSAPAPAVVPDPSAQIQAEAKINRYNIVSPFGTQTWIPPTTQGAPAMPAATTPAPAQSSDPGGGGSGYFDYSYGPENPRWVSTGPAQSAAAASPSPAATSGGYGSGDGPWTQQITLDPSQQRQFDARNQVAEAMLGRANTQFGQLPTTPFSFDPSGGGSRAALDRMGQSNPNFTQQYGQFNPNIADLGQFNPNTYSDRSAFNPNVNAPGQFNPNISAPGQFNSNPNDAQSQELVARLRSLTDTPWSANVDGSAIRDAVYGKAKLLLDPTYGKLQTDLDQRLVNQGLPIGSEAYGQANDVFGRERSNAYNNAAFDAITQGANEEQNQFGRALSTRQQNVNDIAGALSGSMGLYGANYGRQLTNQQQQQSDAQADFGRQLSTQQQREAGAQADYGRQANTRQIQSSDINDIFQRVLAGRQQQTGEQQADYARQLATRGQQAGEFGDDFARQQAQQQSLFTGSNALDQQAQARQLTQRQQQYNELAALLGGQQLNPLNPTGGAVDVSSAYANQQAALNRQYQGQLAGYNADVASGNSTLGGLFGLGVAGVNGLFRIKK